MRQEVVIENFTSKYQKCDQKSNSENEKKGKNFKKLKKNGIRSFKIATENEYIVQVMILPEIYQSNFKASIHDFFKKMILFLIWSHLVGFKSKFRDLKLVLINEFKIIFLH